MGPAEDRERLGAGACHGRPRFLGRGWIRPIGLVFVLGIVAFLYRQHGRRLGCHDVGLGDYCYVMDGRWVHLELAFVVDY